MPRTPHYHGSLDLIAAACGVAILVVMVAAAFGWKP